MNNCVEIFRITFKLLEFCLHFLEPNICTSVISGAMNLVLLLCSSFPGVMVVEKVLCSDTHSHRSLLLQLDNHNDKLRDTCSITQLLKILFLQCSSIIYCTTLFGFYNNMNVCILHNIYWESQINLRVFCIPICKYMGIYQFLKTIFLFLRNENLVCIHIPRVS